MNVIWNKLDVERPPNQTWRSAIDKFDVKTFLGTIDKAITELDSMEVLHLEAALLSRLIYRMKSKFRNDKGLKNMEKTNRALINYLTMGLEKEYKNLKCYIANEEKEVILPSKQMLEYVLVRTQGFAKLMARIEEVARYSAHFFKTRITLGHAWSIALIAYAVVSRIWLLSRHLIKRSCSWYNGLYQYLEIFPVIGLPWFPNNQALPCNLKSWLSLKWIDDEIPSNKKWQNTMFKLLKTESINYNDNLADVSNETSSNNANSSVTIDISQKNISTYNMPQAVSTSDTNINDIGEIINRSTFNVSLPKVSENIKDTSTKGRTHINNDMKLVQQSYKIKVKSNKLKHQKGNEAILFTNVNSCKTKCANIMQTEKLKNATKNQKKTYDKVKQSNENILTLDNVKTKFELITLLNCECYPQMDKLQWNMIRNKGKKYLIKLEKCNRVKETTLVQMAIRHLRSWAH